jgi:hypothetical protein
MEKEQLKATLAELLEEVLKARFGGTAYARLSRAHGYADGYMAALLDAGIVQKEELLQLVSQTRREYVAQKTMPVPA